MNLVKDGPQPYHGATSRSLGGGKDIHKVQRSGHRKTKNEPLLESYLVYTHSGWLVFPDPRRGHVSVDRNLCGPADAGDAHGRRVGAVARLQQLQRPGRDGNRRLPLQDGLARLQNGLSAPRNRLRAPHSRLRAPHSRLVAPHNRLVAGCLVHPRLGARRGVCDSFYKVGRARDVQFHGIGAIVHFVVVGLGASRDAT